VISTVAAAAEDKQSLIDALTTLQIILPLLPRSLHPHIEVLVPGVVEAIKSPYAVIRNAAGKALAGVCRSMTEQGMKIVLDKLLPLLGDTKNLSHRQGTMEAIWGEP
jgi:TATA-binding protein-associated factor